jgi:DNA-binding NtrC family response regulator
MRTRPGVDAGLLAVEAQLAATTDVELREARERWIAVLEASYLRELLDHHQGTISAAAKAPGIDRKMFHRLSNNYQIRS